MIYLLEKSCKFNWFQIQFYNWANLTRLAHVLEQVALAYMWMQLSIIYFEVEFSRTGIKKEALRIILLRRNHDSKGTEYY